MKIYVNRLPRFGPYGGGNHFVRALFHRFHELKKDETYPHVLGDSRDPRFVPDTMLLCGLDNDGSGISLEEAIMYRMTLKNDIKIVLRLNENDARKATSTIDPRLTKLSTYLDGTVFVSNYLRDYFTKLGWACKKNTVIVNGVDRKIFKSRGAQNFLDPKIGIVSHHWSDNAMKGEDVTEWIDNDFLKRHGDRFSFTFVGRTRAKLQRSKLVPPLHGQDLGEELSKHEVYISGSRHDPGPNHIIEAIASGIPTYVHKDGGGCVEFAGSDHVYSSFEELEQILMYMRTKNVDNFTSWNDCVDAYVKFIEEVA